MFPHNISGCTGCGRIVYDPSLKVSSDAPGAGGFIMSLSDITGVLGLGLD